MTHGDGSSLEKRGLAATLGSVMPRFSRQLLALVVFAGCVVFDQLTKQVAVERLRGEPDILLLGGMIRIVYAENPGAFLGLGGTLGESTRFWAFVVVVGLILAAAVVYLARNAARLPLTQVWGIALLIAGGGSNWYDRLTNDGRVVDFMILSAGPLQTGVFNVADLAIVAGVITMVFSPKEKAVATTKA